LAKKATSIEEIAAEVGRLFGTTEKHARKWLSQRHTLLEALIVVRDKATGLIGELGGQGPASRDRHKQLGSSKGEILMHLSGEGIETGSPAASPAERRKAEKSNRSQHRTRGWTSAQRKAAAARMKKIWAERRKTDK